MGLRGHAVNQVSTPFSTGTCRVEVCRDSTCAVPASNPILLNTLRGKGVDGLDGRVWGRDLGWWGSSPVQWNVDVNIHTSSRVPLCAQA